MNIIRLFLLIGISLNVYNVQAKKHDAMQLCHFVCSKAEIFKHSKTWINNTKHDLVVRWSLKDPETGKFYTQEPILNRGNRINIDYGVAIDYLEPAEQLDLSIELLRVIKHPKGAGQPLETKPLKAGDMTLSLHKNKFLKNDIFELRRNNNGLLVLKVDKKEVK